MRSRVPKEWCRDSHLTTTYGCAAHFAAGYILGMMLRSSRFGPVLLLVACRPGVFAGAPEKSVPDTARIRRDVAYLASDALEGRGTGTQGNDSAAAFIARQFRAMGLAAPTAGFLQPFDARPAAHQGIAASLRTQNVVSLIPGRDPALRRQYIVLGAHFDHLGRGTFGALDRQSINAIRNGADDNASGTVAIMELARLLKERPTRRSVAIVAFSGEELGLLGSAHFVANAPAPLAIDSVQAMLNFDMVGR
ncbi:MAG: M28 family peptidase, partial [Gemmatimonadaceae bacterium]